MSNITSSLGLKIGWIGLGKMGGPITENLLKAGFDVTVYDIDALRSDALQAKGARVSNGVAELAREVDIIFSIVPDDVAFSHIALGHDGVIANAVRDAIYVDMSTVSPSASQAVRDAAIARGIDFIAAPVSGSTVLAQHKQLTVFASGPAGSYERIKPVLDAISSKQYYVGVNEQARYLKLAINHLVGSTALMLGEALTLGRKGGLEWKLMLDVIGDSVVASPLIKYKLAPLRDRDFSPAFSAKQMLKDMTLVVEAGDAVGVQMATASLVKTKFAEYSDGDGAELDFFSILRAVEADAKIE